MRTERIEFRNDEGQALAAWLDRPHGTPLSFALLACAESFKAGLRISRALAELGIATLRFDVPEYSEGQLGFRTGASDLIAAARHMAAAGQAPALLIGHGPGGAAALAAAGEIASVKAVATIAAPGDPRLQDLTAPIRTLGRALLVLHSPRDEIVGIDNASAIFLPAKHPKSFVSLDTADHLLSRGEDADYAAAVICAWASRYVGAAADAAAEPDDGAVHIEETGAGKFQVQVSVHGSRFFADEPVEVGGLGSGPSPYELVAAGLGACTAMTLRLYADLKGWPLRRTRVAVRHDKVTGKTPADVFDRKIALDGPLKAEQAARLFEIADRCPVHRTLEGGARVVTGRLAATAAAPAAVEAEATEHFHDMEDECRKADGAAR